jgi:hypothetical protein
VKVHYDEGIANHIGPEPCAGVREGAGEAPAGDRTGQPLSREIDVILGAGAVLLAEGNTAGATSECCAGNTHGATNVFVAKPLTLQPQRFHLSL